MRILAIFSLLIMISATCGCSSGNQDAPSVTQAHPVGWILAHAFEAQADLNSCQVCHNLDFTGSGKAVSCFSCHLTGPPFALHPPAWAGPDGSIIPGHRVWPESFSWTSCSVQDCHGPQLKGGTTGPDCFTAGCHDVIPMTAHALPFTNAADHGPQARLRQDFCRNCHGIPLNSFDGGFVVDPAILTPPNAAGDCSAAGCHPDATAHPTNWQGSNDQDPTYNSSHRRIDVAAQSNSCALCHNTDGSGPGPFPGAPSCFSDSFANANGLGALICHPQGPGTAPHPVDGSFLSPAAHGRLAKADLTFCQECHGEAGGIGSNPRFNRGITDINNTGQIPNPGNGCEGCHPLNYAHPLNWAGPNLTFHYSAASIQASCTLCHGVSLDGAGVPPSVGISCLNCHAETTTFTLDCSSCHGFPPDGVTAEPVVAAGGGQLVDHLNVTNIALHDTCALCHGVNNVGMGTTGTLDTNANYATFDKVNDVNGDHWDGNINMNGPSAVDPVAGTGVDVGVGYNQGNFGCDNALCHGNDNFHRLSDSLLPVEFGDYGTGF